MQCKRSSYKVFASVIKKGTCSYYKEGDSFPLTGFTPKGLCDSAYAVLSRDALALRYGAALPWQTSEHTVTTHCPDPTGAVWELKRIPREATDAEPMH
ncbi:MAG: TIGR04076 family protein [Candidatus Brocadiaceae bacterium]|nr:TIGR04076 family protein [Candidatus Brocadiaceae bacterium]